MFVYFKNGNKKAQESYYTVHNLDEAKRLSTGKGVKIGIIDWLFGDERAEMYSGFYDATEKGFINNKEHGYAMANTLKEVAPNCKVFALNGITKESLNNDKLKVEFLEKSIQFAIKNNIRILTYSHAAITDEKAVKKLKQILKIAKNNNIITIFLHCDLKNNIMPVAIGSKVDYKRAKVFNIYQYDYNALNPIAYKKWMDSKKTDKGSFLSWSSMAPVLAGFIAMLIELNPLLTKQQVVEALDKTATNDVPSILRAINYISNS